MGKKVQRGETVLEKKSKGTLREKKNKKPSMRELKRNPFWDYVWYKKKPLEGGMLVES